MNATRARRAQGYILVPVMAAITLLAAVVFLLNRDAGMNMAMAARGLQADGARYVAEAGLAQLNYQTQNRNCSGYTNLAGTAFGTESFNANVTPTSGSPVTYTSTGTTASGASATLTRANVTVLQTTPQTKTLQPGTALADTYIGGLFNSANFGADTEIQIEGNNFSALVQFDLGSIPTGAYIQSAQFSLYKPNSSGGSGTGQSVTAYRATRAWVEGTKNGAILFVDGATWDTSNGSTSWTSNGGDYDTSLGSTLAYSQASGWKTWDVTDIVASWVSGGYPNNGLVLVPTSGVPNASYISGDNVGNFPWSPKLVVTFLPPCGWSAPTATVTLGPTIDTYIDSGNNTKNYGASTTIKLDGGGGSQMRVLASFDTSGITAGTLLQTAKLRLYVASISGRKSSPKDVQAFAVSEAWVEGTKTGSGTADGATWKRKNTTLSWTAGDGGSYTSPAAGSVTLPASFLSGWVEIDLKPLVQQWVNGGTPNYGVIVTLSTDETFNINSRETSSNEPQLVISY